MELCRFGVILQRKGTLVPVRLDHTLQYDSRSLKASLADSLGRYHEPSKVDGLRSHPTP